MKQLDFAKKIGIDPSNLSKFLTGRLPITEAFINKIALDLNVSKAWLVHGTGTPFSKMAYSDREYDEIVKDRGVPVYDIDVCAGCTELSRMFTDERIIGWVKIPKLTSNHTIVRVSGDSMVPVIANGGYVAIRELSDMHNIFWGQIYVIVLEDYRLVKYLRRHPACDSKIMLHSANPDYDDMEIDRKDIHKMYLVEAILNF